VGQSRIAGAGLLHVPRRSRSTSASTRACSCSRSLSAC
jgi:hypothetical protein